MALNAVEKATIVKKAQHNTKDVGSPEVQVSILTANIEKLQSHFFS